MLLDVAGLAVWVRGAIVPGGADHLGRLELDQLWSAMVMASRRTSMPSPARSPRAGSRGQTGEGHQGLSLRRGPWSGHAEDHTGGPLTSGSAGARSPHNSIARGDAPPAWASHICPAWSLHREPASRRDPPRRTSSLPAPMVLSRHRLDSGSCAATRAARRRPRSQEAQVNSREGSEQLLDLMPGHITPAFAPRY